MRVVCVDDAAFTKARARSGYSFRIPEKGEIYTPDGICPKSNFLYLKEFNFIVINHRYRIAFDPKYFRPVDDTFGEVICEILEQQIEYEKV